MSMKICGRERDNSWEGDEKMVEKKKRERERCSPILEAIPMKGGVVHKEDPIHL